MVDRMRRYETLETVWGPGQVRKTSPENTPAWDCPCGGWYMAPVVNHNVPWNSGYDFKNQPVQCNENNNCGACYDRKPMWYNCHAISPP